MEVATEDRGLETEASVSAEDNPVRRSPRNLTPVTCADIKVMCGDTWKFRNHQSEKLSLVGIVRSNEVTSVRTTLLIDDRTGPPVVCQSFDVNHNRLRNIVDGVYVKVFGHLCRQSVNVDGTVKTMIIAFKIQPLSSINEVFRHSLECTHSKLSYLTSDKRAEELLSKRLSTTSLLPVRDGIVAGEPIVSTSLTSVSTTPSVPNDLSRVHKIVYMAIRDGGNRGISIEKVSRKLATHTLKPCEVRDSIEFLAKEGHVYTTIDDETYACVEAV